MVELKNGETAIGLLLGKQIPRQYADVGETGLWTVRTRDRDNTVYTRSTNFH